MNHLQENVEHAFKTDEFSFHADFNFNCALYKGEYRDTQA